jgi:hypothetical protein
MREHAREPVLLLLLVLLLVLLVLLLPTLWRMFPWLCVLSQVVGACVWRLFTPHAAQSNTLC